MEVFWYDSWAQTGWRHDDEPKAEIATFTCSTVGYLVNENTKHIVLAQTLSMDDEQHGSIFVIPKVNITKKSILGYRYRSVD
jgi:hypothetical protein